MSTTPKMVKMGRFEIGSKLKINGEAVTKKRFKGVILDLDGVVRQA